MKKSLLIFGHYGVPNWGDEMILSGILSQLDQKKFDITVVTDDIEFTKHHHNIEGTYPPPFGIRSLFRGGFFRFLSILKKTDYIIIGGGGLFQANPPFALKLWEYYLQWSTWYNKKIFILGNSFESIPKNINIRSLKKKLKDVRFFSVRDSVSKEYLKTQFEISPSRIAQTSDAAYFINPENYIQQHNQIQNKKIILLAIREGELMKKQSENLLESLFSHFPKAEYQIEFLSMQSKNAKDEVFAQRYNLDVFIPESKEALLKKISSSSFIFTSRLHGGILANIFDVPFIAINISPREKLLQFFGKKFCLSSSDFDTIRGSKKIKLAVDNKEEYLSQQQTFKTEQIEKLQFFFPEFL